ncbi:MAG TPA: lytic transglycosylase domain-containing protein [Streptosporangiaceae bacterium]
MRSQPRPGPPPTATAARLLRGAALAGLGLAIGAGTVIAAVPAGAATTATTVRLAAAHRPSSVPPVSVVFPRMGRHGSRPAGATDAAPFSQIILPDLLVVAPQGLSPAAIAKIRKLTGVRHVIGFDGGEIKAGRRAVSVIGVRPSQFRAWTPLRTASDQRFWTALAEGRFAASPAARKLLGLRPGSSYQLTGAAAVPLTFGRSAPLGVDGIDLVVNSATSRRLGLVHQVAALISAPGASLGTLTAAVHRIAGRSARIVDLRAEEQPAPGTPTLPTGSGATSGLPATYLELFQQSAARYCPALSWTVLAAIGQIESADGTNVGPSSAGAVGPMQFLPSTWSVWGISGFGRTGPPDIMNPYDAVPSAARMLCADGASQGTQTGLRAAVFAYNHADWYVSEVLALAAEYAKAY